MSDNTILEIVFRQEISEQDSKQDNNLNGSLHLCQMLFAEENLDMSETQMDAYLNYVYQEEACVLQLWKNWWRTYQNLQAMLYFREIRSGMEVFAGYRKHYHWSYGEC